MSDRREEIMVRLHEIVAGISAFKTAVRNTTTFDETHLPAVAVLEGDEDVTEDERDFSRPSDKPYFPVATPQIYVRVSDSSADVGTALNTLKAAVFKAVVTDSALKALSLNGRGVRYAGKQSTLHAARSMLAADALVFTIKYKLDPQDL